VAAAIGISRTTVYSGLEELPATVGRYVGRAVAAGVEPTMIPSGSRPWRS